MKKLFLSLLIFIIIFNKCTPDVQVVKGDTSSVIINPVVNKSFTYYNYKEFLPKFISNAEKVDTVLVDNVMTFNRTRISIDFPLNPNNPSISDGKANLGRILFYDKSLSANGEVACGSCHLQSKAFTDGLDFSKGLTGESTRRSSMSIQNLAFINNYFWDSRVQSLEELVKQPILNQVEMGNHSMDEVVARLKTVRYYPELFQNAFGSEGINEASVSKALLHFVQSIYSANSKFDKGIDIGFQNFNFEELSGLELFNGKAGCNHCHAAPTFAAPDFTGGTYGITSNITSIGAPASVTGSPKSKAITEGRTNNGLDAGTSTEEMFKIPTLRNITLTAPYMHDGRFGSLEEVIEHYDHGIKMNASLDPALMSSSTTEPGPKKLNLNEKEKSALIAFLKTLSDPELTTASRYSNPFLN